MGCDRSKNAIHRAKSERDGIIIRRSLKKHFLTFSRVILVEKIGLGFVCSGYRTFIRNNRIVFWWVNTTIFK